MHAQLQSVVDSAEKEEDALIAHVSTLPPDQYFRRPAEGKWSIGEIMTHLVVVEQLSLGYMKKKSQAIDQLKDSGVITEIKFRFYSVALGLPIKLKAPAVILERTPEALPLSELEIQWKTSRNKLKEFLSMIEDKHIRRMIFKHAFAGRLNAIHAVRFFIEHIHHHRPQIDKIMHSSKS